MTCRRTSIFTLRSVKFEEVSREMLVLMLQHVSSRVASFLVPSQCLWGELQNLSLLKVSKQLVMSFSVAGVALPDIFTIFHVSANVSKIVPRGRRNTFATFSEDAFAFCVAGAALWRPPMSFCGAIAAL